MEKLTAREMLDNMKAAGVLDPQDMMNLMEAILEKAEDAQAELFALDEEVSLLSRKLAAVRKVVGS